MTSPAHIDRETAIARTFRAAFASLDDFRAKNPEAAARIDETIAMHLRSAAPMALLSLPPAVATTDPIAEVGRDLASGIRYLFRSEGDAMVLRLHDTEDDGVFITVMTSIEWFRLRADGDAVAAGIGAKP